MRRIEIQEQTTNLGKGPLVLDLILINLLSRKSTHSNYLVNGGLESVHDAQSKERGQDIYTA